MLQLLVTIVTSAAVGAIVSSALTLYGQKLERSARRRELLLTKAIEVANKQVDLERTSGHTNEPALYGVAGYTELAHSQLTHLLEEGELPSEARPHPSSPRGKRGWP